MDRNVDPTDAYYEELARNHPLADYHDTLYISLMLIFNASMKPEYLKK